MLMADLWTDIDVRSDHWAPAPGLFDSTAFWLDVLIAEGLMIRRWDEEQGDYFYCHMDYGPERQSVRVH